jgi:hypothetical protein
MRWRQGPGSRKVVQRCSETKPADKSLHHAAVWQRRCSTEQHVQFPALFELQQIVKATNMMLTNKDLRYGSRPLGRFGKGVLRSGVGFEAAFFEHHLLSSKELLGLRASAASPAGPNHDLGVAFLGHGFGFSCRVSILGFVGGPSPLGSLGRSAPRVLMLPDTVHKLPREERFAYARLLAFMARIDNELTVDEMAMFEQRLGTALLSPNQREMIRAALKNPPTLEECLADLHGEAGRLALRDSVMMAAADGTVDEDERDALEDISEHLGLREDAVDELLQWTIKGYKWMKEGYELLETLEE